MHKIDRLLYLNAMIPFFCWFIIVFTIPACNSGSREEKDGKTNAQVDAEKGLKRPNILWIYIEDMNPFLGCYGDSTVPTPNLDNLAGNGVLFEKAFAPSPVCSPTRSAIITGVMQTTIGAHNHNSAYNAQTPIYLPAYLEGHTLPEIFQSHGYSTFNEGKDHYNFTYKRDDLYTIPVIRESRDKHWSLHPWRELEDKSKPFFGQIQLEGGKYFFRNQLDSLGELPRVTHEAASKTLPPYYPMDEVFLDHWAMHYDAIRLTDSYVGRIIRDLEQDGLLDQTVIICFSDHGCYMPRHKQFCYEGGLHVPCIINAPGSYARDAAGTRRSDIISILDVSATSLAFAGIEIPQWYDSKDLFSKTYNRDFVVAAKDRMDFTIDRVRSLRTKDDMKYIRNYMTDRPYMQLNYRHGREYMVRMDSLFEHGLLSDVQARFWSNYRPSEELYDLKKDPHEINNLAYDPAYRKVLLQLRGMLESWVLQTDDKGQYPEDEANLKHTYEIWGDNKCINPEYDRFRPDSLGN